MEIKEGNQSGAVEDQVQKTGPDSGRKKQSTVSWSLFFARLFLWSVIYVLSFGPMYWSWFKSMYLGGDSFFVRLYAPLIWLGQIKFFGEWLQRYVEWWNL